MLSTIITKEKLIFYISNINKPNYSQLVFDLIKEYCLENNKDETDVEMLIMALKLHPLRQTIVNYLIQIIIDKKINELSICKVIDNKNNIIKIY
jgi:hypothetical protein